MHAARLNRDTAKLALVTGRRAEGSLEVDVRPFPRCSLGLLTDPLSFEAFGFVGFGWSCALADEREPHAALFFAFTASSLRVAVASR